VKLFQYCLNFLNDKKAFGADDVVNSLLSDCEFPDCRRSGSHTLVTDVNNFSPFFKYEFSVLGQILCKESVRNVVEH
jgi:hypothetical protein